MGFGSGEVPRYIVREELQKDKIMERAGRKTSGFKENIWRK